MRSAGVAKAGSSERRKRGRKFLGSSGDQSLVFERREKVLFLVTLPRIAAVKLPVFPACGVQGQTGRDILPAFQLYPQGIGDGRKARRPKNP